MARRVVWNDSLAGVHVLVLAADVWTRNLLTSVLRYCEAAVTPAGSAPEALRRLEDVLPNVVVADVTDDEGLQFVRDLRRRPAEAGGLVPAVILTPRERGAARARAFEAGCQEQLLKPVTPWALCRAVADLSQPASL